MSASNNRIKAGETVHHILNRIAHRVYFLGEDERNDFVGIMRRAAEFSGIRLLAWCVLTNHFHLLAYLPFPIEVEEQEVLRRYGALKGLGARERIEQQIAVWRRAGESGESRVKEWLDSQRRRMGSVGEFMKIVKQWFTEEYNRRHAHVGTLWESAYQDRLVKMSVAEMSRRMGYIHLNPIRAAAAATYDGYLWSSFSAFVQGDRLAEEGMRFVYDDEESSVEELRARHLRLLDELLEYEKRRRAEEIARKRAAGYAMPVDHLTTEAMVAQAAAQMDKVRTALEELRVKNDTPHHMGREARNELCERRLKEQMRLHPMFSVAALADATGLAVPTVYKYIGVLKKMGVVLKHGKKDPWEVVDAK